MTEDINPRVTSNLRAAKSKLDAALEEYEDGVLPVSRVEFAIRQALHLLKDARQQILHG